MQASASYIELFGLNLECLLFHLQIGRSQPFHSLGFSRPTIPVLPYQCRGERRPFTCLHPRLRYANRCGFWEVK